MNLINKIAIALVLAASLSFGQTTLSTTTLGAAVTTGNNGIAPIRITLASTSTMQGTGNQNQPNTVLYVDKELMYVTTVVSSTVVDVQRAKGGGAGGVVTNHASGAIVYFANTSGPNAAPSFFSGVQTNAETFGACTSNTLLALPRIYVYSGDIFQCLGSKWVQVDQPGRPVLGTVVASPAGVMTGTGTIFHVSGTNAVTGLTVPVGLSPGMSFYLIPDAAFTTTTATNISLASTAVANKTLIMTWDGTKWNPSY